MPSLTMGRWWGARPLVRLPQRLIALPGAVLGAFLGGYTGVLLTATSVPLWSRSKVLGGVFISSAVSTSATLISLVLRIAGAPAHTLHKLERLEWTAILLEITGLLTFLRGAGRAARPLVGTAPAEHGRAFWSVVFGGGLLLPWLVQSFSLLRGRRKNKKNNARGLVLSLLVLTGGYFLRRTMVEAGHTSSKGARTTLWNARR